MENEEVASDGKSSRKLICVGKFPMFPGKFPPPLFLLLKIKGLSPPMGTDGQKIIYQLHKKLFSIYFFMEN
jgi:hypothetical protein